MKKRLFLILFMFFLPFFLFAQMVQQGGTDGKRILLVNSFAEDDAWVSAIETNLFRTLQVDKLVKASFDKMTLDVHGHEGNLALANGINSIQRMLEKKKYDFVITLGNEAGDIFLLQNIVLPYEIPLLLVHYTGNYHEKNAAGLPVTAVVAQHRAYAVARFINKSLPTVKDILFVYGAAEASQAYLRNVRANKAIAPDVNIEWYSGRDHSTEDLKQRLRTMNPKTGAVVFFSWSSDLDDHSAVRHDYRFDFSEYFNGPIFGYKDTQETQGAIAGCFLSAAEFGEVAAHITERVFSGEKIETIPMQLVFPKTMIQYKAMRKFGIGRDDLPKDAVIIGEPAQFLREHKLVFTVLGTIILLVFLLFILRMYMDKKEIHMLDRVAGEHERMRKNFLNMIDTMAHVVISCDKNGCVVFVNRTVERLLNVKRETLVGRPIEELLTIFSYPQKEALENPVRAVLQTHCDQRSPNFVYVNFLGGESGYFSYFAALNLDSEESDFAVILNMRDQRIFFEQAEELYRSSVMLKFLRLRASFRELRFSHGLKTPLDELWQHLEITEGGKTYAAKEWIKDEILAEIEQKWSEIQRGESTAFELELSAKRTLGFLCFYEVWIQYSMIPETGTSELLGFIQNTTQFRSGEMRVRDLLQMQSVILKYLPGYLFVKDINQNFRYVLCNPAFEKLTNRSEAEIVGHYDYEIFSEFGEESKNFERDDRALVESGGTVFETKETLNNGETESTLKTIKTIVKQEDGSKYLVGIGFDLSKEAALEKERETLIASQNRFIEWERFTNRVLIEVLNKESLHAQSVAILRNLAQMMNASRSYILKYKARESVAEYLYSWESDTHQMERVTDFKLDLQHFKKTYTSLSEFGELSYTQDSIKDKPEWQAEYEALETYGVYGRYYVELKTSGVPYGMLGLDFTHENMPQEDVFNLLHNLGRIFELAYIQVLRDRVLANSVDLQRQIVERLPIPVTITDTNFNLVVINTAARDKAVDKELAAHWEKRSPGEKKIKCHELSCGCVSPPAWCPAMHLLETGEIKTVSHSHCDRHFISSAVPLYDLDGKMCYILSTDVDVTEQEEQNKNLRTAVEEAKRANAAKSIFLASMSHEIRTPLNAIIGFSELLKELPHASKEEAEYIQSIYTAGNGLLGLINDILDLSKLDAGKTVFENKFIDLSSLLRDIASLFTKRVRDKNIELRLALQENVPQLFLDAMRIRQVALNIIGNAVKYTDKGSITIETHFTEKTKVEGCLEIIVTDTGCGIEESYMKEIWEPFSQQDAQRDTHTLGGTGLGLAICSRLVRQMKGEILLRSKVGVGSAFTIVLPHIRYEEKQAPQAETQAIAAVSTRPATIKRVMLVDDVAMNLRILSLLFKRLQIDTILASSAGKALELLQTEKVDAVFTDLWMPGMNGEALEKAIHAQEALRDLKVVIVTADVDATKASDGGFCATLLKPITLESLQAVVEKIS